MAALDRRALQDLVKCDPRIATNLLELVMDRLAGRERHLEAVTLHDPDRQLARQFLALAETIGRWRGDHVVLEARITHQMLADMLGVRRETVTLHLTRLTQEGAVAIVGGRFEFDVRALRAVAKGGRSTRRSA